MEEGTKDRCGIARVEGGHGMVLGDLLWKLVDKGLDFEFIMISVGVSVLAGFLIAKWQYDIETRQAEVQDKVRLYLTLDQVLTEVRQDTDWVRLLRDTKPETPDWAAIAKGLLEAVSFESYRDLRISGSEYLLSSSTYIMLHRWYGELRKLRGLALSALEITGMSDLASQLPGSADRICQESQNLARALDESIFGLARDSDVARLVSCSK